MKPPSNDYHHGFDEPHNTFQLHKIDEVGLSPSISDFLFQDDTCNNKFSSSLVRAIGGTGGAVVNGNADFASDLLNLMLMHNKSRQDLADILPYLPTPRMPFSPPT